MWSTSSTIREEGHSNEARDAAHRHPTPLRQRVARPSQTTDGVQYFVNADVTRCTCKGFAYRGACTHLRMISEAKALIEGMLEDA
jgi:hypothetical protein